MLEGCPWQTGLIHPLDWQANFSFGRDAKILAPLEVLPVDGIQNFRCGYLFRLIAVVAAAGPVTDCSDHVIERWLLP